MTHFASVRPTTNASMLMANAVATQDPFQPCSNMKLDCCVFFASVVGPSWPKGNDRAGLIILFSPDWLNSVTCVQATDGISLF